MAVDQTRQNEIIPQIDNPALTLTNEAILNANDAGVSASKGPA